MRFLRGYEITVGFLFATAFWVSCQTILDNQFQQRSTIEVVKDIEGEHKSTETHEFYGIKPGEFLLFFATMGLWYATARLVKGVDTTAQRQLRAYVGVQPRDFAFKRGQNKAIHCSAKLTIKNTGQTPAYDVRSDADFRIAPERPKDEFKPLKGNAVTFNSVIQPHSEIEGSVEKGLDISDVRNGDKLYLVGRITYRDAFGETRVTSYCGFIAESSTIFGSTPVTTSSISITFKWSEKHNDAT